MGKGLAKYYYLAFVFAGVIFASMGIWNAGLPYYDEAVHVSESFAVLENGLSSTTNVYTLTYAALLSTFTNDPVVAHLIVRFAASLASTLGLYLVLGSFRSVSSLARAIVCISWAGSSLCSPFSQFGNINLFSFALTLPGFAYLLRKPSLNSVLVFALGVIWAAGIRLEYLAPLILVSGVALLLIATKPRVANLPSSTIQVVGNGFLTIALAGSMLVVLSKHSGPAPEGYLLQGLGQCYGVYYKRLHPAETFDPMNEYQGVLDKVFGNPRSFSEALVNNPAEAAHYFVHNGAWNLVRIIPGLLRSNRYWPIAAIIALPFLFGTAIGIWRLVHSQKYGDMAEVRFRDGLDKTLLLFLFASASSVAIVLLIDDPRYWITAVPLVYLWFAWAIDKVIDHWRLAHRETIALLVAVALLAFPPFLGKAKYSNQNVIYALRDSMSGLQREPVVAGKNLFGLITWAFAGKAKEVRAAGLDPQGLKSRYYDVFVQDGLEESTLWASNRSFFQAFVRNPEVYGYRLLQEGIPLETRVYVRIF